MALLDCVKRIQNQVSIQELDLKDFYSKIGIAFVRDLAKGLPQLKELKTSLRLGHGQGHSPIEIEEFISAFIESSREIEGVGFSIPYNIYLRTQYMHLFEENRPLSQNNLPLALRSLVLETDQVLKEGDLAERFPGLHILSIKDASLASFPNFLELESLTIQECRNIESLDLPTVEQLDVKSCSKFKTIDAPEAQEILCANNHDLLAINAEKARVAKIVDCPNLTSLSFPFAKKVEFDPNKPCMRLNQIAIPEDCELIGAPMGVK